MAARAKISPAAKRRRQLEIANASLLTRLSRTPATPATSDNDINNDKRTTDSNRDDDDNNSSTNEASENEDDTYKTGKHRSADFANDRRRTSLSSCAAARLVAEFLLR